MVVGLCDVIRQPVGLFIPSNDSNLKHQ